MTIKKLPSQPSTQWHKLNELIDTVNALEQRVKTLEDVGIEIDSQRVNALEERVERWENQELECEPNIAIDTPQEKPSFREVTLRIPKGMTIGNAVFLAWGNLEWNEDMQEDIQKDVYNCLSRYREGDMLHLDYWLVSASDTDLQAEIDKIGDDDE